jgi:hypothetical protein
VCLPPLQATGKRDSLKRLDGANARWQSKLEGVLDAGFGMHMYVARSALAGGPNLVLTSLFLAIFYRVEQMDLKPLGSHLRLQLDNTTGENKCTAVIGVCAWLVHMGYFQQVTMGFQPKGHTFNELDQAFSPTITQLHQEVVLTPDDLLSFLRQALKPKQVRTRDR